MIQPTRVLQLAKEKSQALLSLDSERFTCKLDKFLTVYHGYSQIKPRIFPKRMTAMFPSNVVVAADLDDGAHKRQFQPGFGSTASLKRHQVDWSEKYQRTRPAYAEGGAAVPLRTEPDRSRRLQIVANSTEDLRKPYTVSSVSGPRGKKANAKSPRRVVLRSGNGHDSSSDVLCSSVLLTYREGLFYKDRQRPASQRESNCSDV